MQVAFFCCFRQGMAGISRHLGRDVPGSENFMQENFGLIFVPYKIVGGSERVVLRVSHIFAIQVFLCMSLEAVCAIVCIFALMHGCVHASVYVCTPSYTVRSDISTYQPAIILE